ncbi:MAG TPA: acyl-CoA dehydrogenase family protein [Stellaceae bacterium]|nr:acyl-CoA dehydrogenase family protein [Stellaceae bacterium]
MTESLVTETAERLFADLATPAVVNAAEAGTWASELWSAVAEAGFLDALGGDAGGGLEGLGAAADILCSAGRHAVPLPIAETMLARWLTRRAGLTPPEGPLALVVDGPEDHVELRRTGTGWQISGAARRVPWASNARGLVVSTDAAVALVAPVGAVIEHGKNLAGEPRDDITLDLKLDARSVAGAPVDADAAVVYRLGALFRAAQMAGALEEALQLAVTYAGDRVQFGRPIAKFQAIQQQLALAAEQVAASGVAVASAVAAAEAGDLAFAAGSAKLRVGEAAGRVCDIVHQVHGAIGFTHEHRLHQLTRRLWSWRDEFGVESAWALELGRLVASQGADGIWPFLAQR